MRLENSYLTLPKPFYRHCQPSLFPTAEVFAFNQNLAEFLQIEFETQRALDICFTGQDIPSVSLPIALAYAGHQFGHFVDQLGDGRALIIGTTKAKDEVEYDIQLKGSGPTPFSRKGDGLSPLGPVIREYLVSEAMHSLKIPTTRSLAAATTGELVQRETSLAGGILTRVARSHIRVGTFEYFAARQDIENLSLLLNYTIERLYPEIDLNSETYIHEFYRAFVKRTASLIAKWMGLGFIHGVMNTDNCSIAGETIDYGPCAFMDAFAANKKFSFIDTHGRYAYDQQAPIGQWNCARLADCLMLLATDKTRQKLWHESFTQSLEEFANDFNNCWLEIMGRKLGITNIKNEDQKLIRQWLTHLETQKLDFTQSHDKLAREFTTPTEGSFPQEMHPWFEQWRQRISNQEFNVPEIKSIMSLQNPVIIPRNHLVEKAIQLAYNDDFEFFHRFHEALKTPFSSELRDTEFAQSPEAGDEVTRTFCGT